MAVIPRLKIGQGTLDEKLLDRVVKTAQAHSNKIMTEEYTKSPEEAEEAADIYAQYKKRDVEVEDGRVDPRVPTYGKPKPIST